MKILLKNTSSGFETEVTARMIGAEIHILTNSFLKAFLEDPGFTCYSNIITVDQPEAFLVSGHGVKMWTFKKEIK